MNKNSSEQICPDCKHSDGVNERGECVHDYAVVPSGSATWKDTHCGCKCPFSEAAVSDEPPYRTHVTSCEACSGPYGHCSEGLRLLRADSAASEGIPEPIQPRFTKNGQELAVCRYCGHEIIALSKPPYPRNWVHNNPHRSYPVRCQLETRAEPSDLAENVSAEAADAYLRGQGVIRKCEACGQDATLTNDFVTHLMKRYQAKCEEIVRVRSDSPSVDEAARRAVDELKKRGPVPYMLCEMTPEEDAEFANTIAGAFATASLVDEAAVRRAAEKILADRRLLVSQLMSDGTHDATPERAAILAEIISTELKTSDSGETSVQAALEELREMFPNTYCNIRSNGSGHVRFDNGEIHTTKGAEIFIQFKDADKKFIENTLSEAMAKVREWKSNSDSGKVEK